MRLERPTLGSTADAVRLLVVHSTPGTSDLGRLRGRGFWDAVGVVVGMRNRLAHGRTPDEDDSRRLTEELESQLAVVFEALHALEQEALLMFAAPSSVRGHLQLQQLRLMGASPKGWMTVEYHTREEAERAPAEGVCVENGAGLVSLWPLMLPAAEVPHVMWLSELRSLQQPRYVSTLNLAGPGQNMEDPEILEALRKLFSPRGQ